MMADDRVLQLQAQRSASEECYPPGSVPFVVLKLPAECLHSFVSPCKALVQNFLPSIYLLIGR